jgi:diguanylate cyclase (GGDEF)-like protein
MKQHRPKILLVDDDPAMLRLVTKWLECDGYPVEQAANGVEAMAAIEASCPDMLITDWNMPKMNGMELCERVRGLRLSKYVYILFLTVRSDENELVKGLDVGADEFLSKPINRDELLARVRAGERFVTLERRLSQMARTDELTGLRTRRSFHDIFDKEWDRVSRRHLPMSCVMLDIDFFKRVNDNHGHQFGDQIIRLVGECLESNCRASDTVSRYGGEEFCALLTETPEEEAALWAERTRARLAALRIPVDNDFLQVTCSFGVAQRSDDTATPHDLIDRADQALMAAKQSGRDRVVRFDSMCEAGKSDLQDPWQTEDLLAGVTAGDVMTPMIACLNEDQTIGSAAEFFLRSRINSIPVVDRTGQLAGMLSEKDLLAAMVSLECWRKPVREVMKPNVIWYAEDAPIRKIYEFLCRVTIRRVVIVRDGRPSGTISRGALLRWFRNLVLASGRVSDQANLSDSQQTQASIRRHLTNTAKGLEQQAAALEHAIADEANPLACAVAAATRMQELVDDLLAHSRDANDMSDRAGMLQLWALDGARNGP